jgi:hypothetical protein
MVYRAAPDVLRAVRFGNRSMTTVWRHRSEGPLGPPLLVGDKVYVTSTTGLRKFTLGHRNPIWTVAGSFEGPPALGPDGLRALAYTPRRSAELRLVEPSSGAEMSGIELGAIGKDPGTVHPAALTLLANGSFLEFSAPVFDGSDLRILGVERSGGGDGRPFRGLTSLPASVGEAWIAKGVAPEGEYLFRCDASGPQALHPLASRTDFPRLFDNACPIAVSGSVAYIGTLACDLESSPGQEHVWGAEGRVLWRIDGLQPSERPVPARETVLYVDQAKRLVAVRARTVRGHRLVGEATPGAVRGTLVLRDGTIEGGEFTLDPAGQRVQRSTKARTENWSFADVLLLEDAEANIVLAGDPVRGLHHLAESAQAAGYLELAKRARPANEPALLVRLVNDALVHGAQEKETEPLWAAAEKQVTATARPNAELVATLETEAAALARLPQRLVWERILALPEATRPKLETLLLRGLLERDPRHAEAREAARALVPEQLRPKGEFDALDALRLVEAMRRTRIELFAPPAEGARNVPFEQIQIGQRQPFWRKDLHAIRSDNLLIVTPVRELGTLARCLALGELVCKTLSEWFQFGTLERGARDPMVIELFPTREEFLQAGARKGLDLRQIAGLYDMRANVTRLYLPAEERAFQDELAVLAHEIAHHWLRMRCPAWPFRPLSEGDFEQPGFWVVEGFASYFEEFCFDLENGTWSPGGETSLRLDLVAYADPALRMPWAKFFAESNLGFFGWRYEGPPEAPSSIFLGKRHIPSAQQMFYAQAAATTRYLCEAQGGALRPKLFDFLRAYYTGEREKLDLPAVLGVEAEELGRAIVEHARSVLKGAR